MIAHVNKDQFKQREIALNPHEVATKLGSFLELDTAQPNQINNVCTHNRPQSTGDIESRKAITIDELDGHAIKFKYFVTHVAKSTPSWDTAKLFVGCINDAI